MSSHRKRRLDVRTGAIATVAALSLAACGGAKTDSQSQAKPSGTSNTAARFKERPLCENANDYTYELSALTGAVPGVTVATPTGARKLFARLIPVSRALEEQVPEDRREQARKGRITFTTEAEILAKYNYAEKGNVAAIVKELDDRLGRYQASNQTYAAYLTITCRPEVKEFGTRLMPLPR